MGLEMNDYNQSYDRGVIVGSGDMARDEGLRSFMLGVYNKMALGLVWSAVLAMIVGLNVDVRNFVLTPPMMYLVSFGPLVLLFGSSFFMRNPSPTGANVLYWSVVTLIGAGLGIFVAMAANDMSYNDIAGQAHSMDFATIGLAFFMTASIFGGISLWGYTTKRDISGWGSMIFAGVIGVILLSLVNFALVSFGVIEIVNPIFHLGVQFLTLGLMIGVVAWQTQSLKMSYYAYAQDGRALSVMTTFGALNLYIAFINIFQILLSLLSRE